MEIAVLGSGSSGNATIVRSGGTTILLEAGLSCKQIVLRARCAGIEPESVQAVFVSHAHSDHVKGAPVFSRRHKTPVFMTNGAYDRWREAAGAGRGYGRERRLADAAAASYSARREEGATTRSYGRRAHSGPARAAGAAEPDPVPLAGPQELYAHETMDESGAVEIGSLKVRTFPVPHDTDGTVGYVVEAEGLRFGYVTDLGHVTTLVEERLRGCDALLIEMNHDPDLLREGPYPWDVKQRIASRHGHLSNEQGAMLLEQSLGGDTRIILLGHLSETNNQPSIALATARLAVERRGRGDVSILPAEPHRPSRAIRL